MQVFSKEASKAVQEDAQTLKNKTAEVVEHFPETVCTEQVLEMSEPNLNKTQHSQAAALPSAVASNLPRVSESGAALEHVGESLTQLGKSLFVGTQALFEQVWNYES